jgi:AraC-like DNA-binding protein
MTKNDDPLARCALFVAFEGMGLLDLTATRPRPVARRPRRSKCSDWKLPAGLPEDTEHGVDRIARTCGFGDEERMRITFQRHLAISPRDYRRRFSSRSLKIEAP